MRRLLQSLAVLLVLGAAAFWLGAGAPRGWTRTSVPVKIVDDVTGIEGVSYKRGFVPGLDFLGGALAGAGALAASSLVFRKAANKTELKPTTE